MMGPPVPAQVLELELVLGLVSVPGLALAPVPALTERTPSVQISPILMVVLGSESLVFFSLLPPMHCLTKGVILQSFLVCYCS